MAVYTVERRCAECSTTFTAVTSARTCSPECRRLRRRRQTARANRRWRHRSARLLSRDVALALRESPHGDGFVTVRVEDLVAIQIMMRSARRGDGLPAELAHRFGVSARTIYRWASLSAPRPVHIGQWVAWFAAPPEGPPVQLTRWIGAGEHR